MRGGRWDLVLLIPAVFKDAFILFLSPLPPGGPGEGCNCHFPKGILGFGPIPAQIRGETYFLFLILALSAAGQWG